MKRLIHIIFVLMALCSSIQCVSAEGRTQGVGKIALEVSDDKWVYLKFPAKIKYADMGTEDIVVEKTKVENILRVKSLVPVFDETAITVIAMDGKIYTYALKYAESPKYIAVDMKGVRDNIIESENTIQPMKLELSTVRTSHLIFKSNIADIAVGVDSIAAELAEEDIMNIAKARQVSSFDGFETTSLTVVTEDREIYPFIVSHNDNPKDLNINVADAGASATFAASSMNELEMEELGRRVVEQGSRMNNIGVYSDKMAFSLASLYIKDDVLMFHIRTSNNSRIDYDVDFIRCYIVNKKNSKNSVSQDDEKLPLFTYRSGDEKIPAGGSYSEVFFFNKFTVPDKHLFYFEMFEKNGGRHMKFTCSNKEILRAEELVVTQEGK